MALRRANPGEIVTLAADPKSARTSAIVKTDLFEAIHLVVQAGAEIKTHQLDGPLTLHCLKGRVALELPDRKLELSGGQWLFLEGSVPHSFQGLEDASLLLTILFQKSQEESARE